MNVNRTKIIPLCGANHFAQLMRTKPQAVWQNLLIHVVRATQQQTHANTSPTFALGLIIPKKVFPHAVDRNRVRRVVRAHARSLVKTTLIDSPPHEQLQLLVRFRALKGKHAAPIFPTSADFSAQMLSTMQAALKSTFQHAINRE